MAGVAVLERAILAEGARIGRGAVVGDPSEDAELTVIGAHARVEPGAQMRGGVAGS